MYTPTCPNHGAQMSPTGDPRIYICPVSNARFEVEAESSQQEQQVDIYGNVIQNLTINALDPE